MRANELVVGSDEHSFAVWFHVMERCKLHRWKKRAHWGFVSFPRLLAYILPCRTGLDSGEKETWSVFSAYSQDSKGWVEKILPLVG